MRREKMLRVWVALVFLLAQMPGVLYAGNVYNDPNNTFMGNTLNGTQPSLTSTANSLANYYINYWKDNSWDWLRRTQFSGSFANGSSPQWTLSTIQPFNNIDSSLNKVWYGSGSYSTNTSTMNLGVGYRQMNGKHSSVYGANLFYDNQFSVNNLGGGDTSSSAFQRVGMGLEYFTGPLEATINGYLGISAPVMVGSNDTTQTWQNVANGIDLNLKTNFDYFKAPWLNLTLTGYQYFGSMTNSVMANGGHFGGVAAQLGWQVTPQLSVNVGRDFGAQSTTAGFNFNLLAAPQPATFCGDQTINSNAAKDLSYKMLQQPQRSNIITAEQYVVEKANKIVVKLTVTDSDGQLLVNMPASFTPILPKTSAASSSAGTTTYTATTDSKGVATFTLIQTAGSQYYELSIPSGYKASWTVSSFNGSTGIYYQQVTAQPVSPVSSYNIKVADYKGNAVSGATIAADGVYVPITETSTPGTYTMKQIPAGTYSGTVKHSGYDTQSFSFTPTAGGDTTVTLYGSLKSITVVPATASIIAGNTKQYTATGTYEDGRTGIDITSKVAWSSSNTAIATMTSSGTSGVYATGLVAGTTNITAASGTITSNAAVLTVEPDTITELAITPAQADIIAGNTQQYTAKATYASGKTGVDVTSSVQWSSSSTAATIDSSGLATGQYQGTPEITATHVSASGTVTSNTATLTVEPNTITGIAVTPADKTVAVGDSVTYTATATYSNGKKGDVTNSVTWSSSEPYYSTALTWTGSTVKVNSVPDSSPVTIYATYNTSINGQTTLTVTALQSTQSTMGSSSLK